MKDICQIIRKPLLYVIINIIISKSETFLFTNLHKKYMLCYTVFCVFFLYIGILGHSNGNLTATEHEIELLIGTCKNFDLVLS